MLRLIAAAAVVASAAADFCYFNRTGNICPGAGQACNEKVLCSTGYYCKVTALGQNGNSYSGVCSQGPRLEEVYNKPCQLGSDYQQCQFDNPLAFSPRTLPQQLRCGLTTSTDTLGSCLLGPQKHGDGCNVDTECASGKCQKALKVCKGVDEGQQCVPGYPDPCSPGLYCSPTTLGSALGGYCVKAASAGALCNWPTACTRGTFCAGPTTDNQRCVAMFSVPTGQNTTIGPYMCVTANAVMVSSGPVPIYQCVDGAAASKILATACSPNTLPPAGYECKCSRDGQYRLRTVGGLGLGSRATTWQGLYKCLVKSTGPTNEACQFDVQDMEQIRYGSCGFYACYPYYTQLATNTGARFFLDPLNQWETAAPCEEDAARAYYARTAATGCINIPNLESWKCATLGPSASLSVTDTQGVLSFIFLVVTGGYIYHIWRFRKENGVHFPCSRLN